MSLDILTLVPLDDVLPPFDDDPPTMVGPEPAPLSRPELAALHVVSAGTFDCDQPHAEHHWQTVTTEQIADAQWLLLRNLITPDLAMLDPRELVYVPTLLCRERARLTAQLVAQH